VPILIETAPLRVPDNTHSSPLSNNPYHRFVQGFKVCMMNPAILTECDSSLMDRDFQTFETMYFTRHVALGRAAAATRCRWAEGPRGVLQDSFENK
jgi:hypothetical protein